MYTISIQPYSRRKDGRVMWLALTNPYSDKDTWGAELKKQEDLIYTFKWKGNSNFSLDKFIAQHRSAFVLMHKCAVHVNFQLPNKFTHVGYLLDAIETTDADLQAAMELICNSVEPTTGKRYNFEATATCLLPHVPLEKKQNSRSDCHRGAEVSAINSYTIKYGVDNMGVNLRYHKMNEYVKLSPEKKSKLQEWRKSQPQDHKKSAKDGTTSKRSTNTCGTAAADNDNKRVKRLIYSALAAERKKVAQAANKNQLSQDEKDGVFLL